MTLVNGPRAPPSKLRQTLCASSITLALNHTLLQPAVKAALVWYSPRRLQPEQWHHHSPDDFCQPQIFLKQDACPGQLISCDTLSEQLPISKDKTSSLYSPSISLYSDILLCFVDPPLEKYFGHHWNIPISTTGYTIKLSLPATLAHCGLRQELIILQH